MLTLIVQLASSLLIVLLLVVAIFLLRRLSRSAGDGSSVPMPPPRMPPFLGGMPPFGLAGDAGGPPARQALLPFSTVSGRGHPLLSVEVFDPAKNSFRRVGVTGARGDGDATDSAGDGIRLVRGKLYRLVARPQCLAFRPEQFYVAEDTPGGADAWLVHDVRVGTRSQFQQGGAVPAGALRALSFTMDTVQTSMDFSVDVSYTGPAEDAPFLGAFGGSTA